MRILMIIDGLPGGGAEKTVLTLCQGMVELGHRVSLFSLREICAYDIPAGVDFQIIADDCKAPWRKLTELSRRARRLDAAVRAAEQQGRFDLVFSSLHKTDRIVARCRAIPHERLWFCIHGMLSVSYLGQRTGLSRAFKRLKIRRVYQGRNLVAVSRAVLDDVTDALGVTLTHGEVIHNPFDIDAIRAQASAFCPMAGEDYLIHVGRFHPHKRHDRLIRAWARSGIAAPLVLMGNATDAQRAAVTALAAELGVADRLVIKPFEPNPYPWIKHARLLALSSDSEGFGNVLVEALICGTAVVSTRCPGGPQEILTGPLARGLSGMSDGELADRLADIWRSPPPFDAAFVDAYGIHAICQRYLALAER